MKLAPWALHEVLCQLCLFSGQFVFNIEQGALKLTSSGHCSCVAEYQGWKTYPVASLHVNPIILFE